MLRRGGVAAAVRRAMSNCELSLRHAVAAVKQCSHYHHLPCAHHNSTAAVRQHTAAAPTRDYCGPEGGRGACRRCSAARVHAAVHAGSFGPANMIVKVWTGLQAMCHLHTGDTWRRPWCGSAGIMPSNQLEVPHA
jgi:hypothetical protein